MILALLLSSLLHAYPQNIRQNYPQCASCHLSPNGGGVLTNYGRSLSEELSTFSYEGEGRVGHSFEQPDWLLTGGDVRWVNYTSKSRALGDRSKRFWMQADLELALAPIKDLWLVGTVGKYNEDNEYEFRRNYLLLTISEHISVRAGRMLPTLGLNVADHRANIHPGQGQERLSAEANYQSQYFQITAQAVGKKDATIRADSRGYKLNEVPGMAATAKILLGTLGFGAYGAKYDLVTRRGAYIYAGHGPIYLLSQFQVNKPDVGSPETLYFGEVGYETFRGFDVYTRLQTKDKTNTYQAGLNWLPRPHWQFLVELDRTVAQGLYIDSFLSMIHYNL